MIRAFDILVEQRSLIVSGIVGKRTQSVCICVIGTRNNYDVPTNQVMTLFQSVGGGNTSTLIFILASDEGPNFGLQIIRNTVLYVTTQLVDCTVLCSNEVTVVLSKSLIAKPKNDCSLQESSKIMYQKKQFSGLWMSHSCFYHCV